MKYKIGDILFNRLLEKNQKGRKVIDIKGEKYKFECKCNLCKSGFVWAQEWMLYTQEEFITEVKAGKLLAMQLQ